LARGRASGCAHSVAYNREKKGRITRFLPNSAEKSLLFPIVSEKNLMRSEGKITGPITGR